MTPFEIPNLRFSLIAGEAISRYDMISVSAEGKAIKATTGKAVVGVAEDGAKIDEPIGVMDGIVIATASAAIEAGAYVEGTTGQAATSAAASNAVAITSAAAANELISIKIN